MTQIRADIYERGQLPYPRPSASSAAKNRLSVRLSLFSPLLSLAQRVRLSPFRIFGLSCFPVQFLRNVQRRKASGLSNRSPLGQYEAFPLRPRRPARGNARRAGRNFVTYRIAKEQPWGRFVTGRVFRFVEQVSNLRVTRQCRAIPPRD